MIWRQNRDISVDQIQDIARELNSNDLLVRIFLNRINDIEQARIALRDFHEAIIPADELVNGQAVADVITEHIKKGSTIVVHADYDADGLNSGRIIGGALSELIEYVNSTATIEVYYPEREHGYGLSMHFAENIIKLNNERKLNGDNREFLIVTVDNGITQVEQVKMLTDNNIEVIVTDHHQSKDIVPNCLICDPHNGHVVQNKTFHHLCGAGVTFKICELIQKNFGYHDMYKYVPYVAIATITDVMPMTIENMTFVRYGLDIINSDMCPAGIKAMKDYLGIDIVNSQHIAWEIGPRLNACGRMNNTKLGGILLSETDYEKAQGLVNEIELLNETRKTHTANAVSQMDKMNFDNDNICIIKLEDLPEGIVGIIAGRATDKFGKPAIVVTEHDGICKGSARSISGLNLHQLFNIEVAKGNMINFGGHAEAAGVQFELSKIKDLQESLNNTTEKLITTMAQDNEEENTEPVLLIDECINISHLNKDTFHLINSLPYDKDIFAKPTFALVDCEVKDFRQTKNKPENLWLTIKQGNQTLKLWCQGMTEVYKSQGCPKIVHLAGYIEKNFMSGRPYTFKVIDIVSAA